MPVYQYVLPPAVGSVQPFAVRGRAFGQPVIRLWMIGPTTVDRVNAVVDPGGECCLFPEWVAWRVGLRRSPASPQLTIGSSITLTGVPAWFETVELELRDPAGVHQPFRWKTVAGFTGRGSFSKTSASGVLGINGGLDHFQRVEFDWASTGAPEVLIRT